MTTWRENFQPPFSNSWLCLHTQSYCHSCLGSLFLCHSLKSVSRNKTSKVQKLHPCFADHLTVFLALDVLAPFIARAQWSRDKEGVRSYQSVQMTGFDCRQTSNSFFEVPQSMGHWDGSAGKGRPGDPHDGKGKLTLIFCPLTAPHAHYGTWAALLQYIQWNIENYHPVLIIDQCRKRVINILGELVQCCYSIIISEQFLYKHIYVYVCARVCVCAEIKEDLNEKLKHFPQPLVMKEQSLIQRYKICHFFSWGFRR